MGTISNKKKREIFGYEYVNHDRTAKDIAAELGISEQTASKWKHDDRLDEAKDELQSSPIILRKKLNQEAIRLSKGEKATIDSDSLSKIMKALETSNKTTSPNTVSSVLKMFDNWMVEVDPKKAIEFTKYHKEFLHHIRSME